MRACYPGHEGFVERGGVPLHREICGAGERTIFFLPTWSIIHSRIWKMQIPYFARYLRVLTLDGRGNGTSGRPQGAASYDDREIVADALAIMDATATERATLVCECHATVQVLIATAVHPSRWGRVSRSLCASASPSPRDAGERGSVQPAGTRRGVCQCHGR